MDSVRFFFLFGLTIVSLTHNLINICFFCLNVSSCLGSLLEKANDVQYFDY